MPISVIVNTKNSAETLKACLTSVKFADQIVVVDMASSDDTVRIAKKFTSDVFKHKDVGFVEPARNYALSKAKHDWILVLDSDEEVPPKLAELLQQIAAEEAPSSLQADCYYLARQNRIFGQWIQHTGWWPDYVLRFFRAGAVSWSDEIHSIPLTNGKVAEFPANENLAIIHHNYQRVEEFLHRLNRYTTIQAQQAEENNQPLEHPVASFREEFLSRFFARQGSEDGQRGIVLSMLQGLSELTVAAKRLEHQEWPKTFSQDETIKELHQLSADLRYWLADYHVQHSHGLMKFWWQIRRKLGL